MDEFESALNTTLERYPHAADGLAFFITAAGLNLSSYEPQDIAQLFEVADVAIKRHARTPQPKENWIDLVKDWFDTMWEHIAKLGSRRQAEVNNCPASAPHIKIPYRNWRGEGAIREIAPIRLFYGSNEWHKEPTWLIEAWDIEKSQIRTFALSGIGYGYSHIREAFDAGIEDAASLVERIQFGCHISEVKEAVGQVAKTIRLLPGAYKEKYKD